MQLVSNLSIMLTNLEPNAPEEEGLINGAGAHLFNITIVDLNKREIQLKVIKRFIHINLTF